MTFPAQQMILNTSQSNYGIYGMHQTKLTISAVAIVLCQLEPACSCDHGVTCQRQSNCRLRLTYVYIIQDIQAQMHYWDQLQKPISVE